MKIQQLAQRSSANFLKPGRAKRGQKQSLCLLPTGSFPSGKGTVGSHLQSCELRGVSAGMGGGGGQGGISEPWDVGLNVALGIPQGSELCAGSGNGGCASRH